MFADVHHEKFDENDHDYNKNMSDLGNTLAQTSIKDEPQQNFQTDPSLMDQSSYTTSKINPSSLSSQSTLVQLLTASRQLNSIKGEDNQSNFGFTGCNMNDGMCFVFNLNPIECGRISFKL